jgi:MFS transporter, CP family, cyanate transporter
VNVATNALALTRSRTALQLVAVVAVAANLRPAIATVGPVLPAMHSDLGISTVEAGGLTTIPTLSMGLFAPIAALLSVRYGARRMVGVGVGTIGVTTGLRWWAPTSAAFLVLALATGAGVALSQTLIPTVAWDSYGGDSTRVMAACGAAINFGAIGAGALAAPLAGALAGWRPALAVWSLPAMIAFGIWVFAYPGGGRVSASREPGLSAVLRRSSTWRIGMILGVVAFAYFVVLAWFAPALEQTGRTASAAGALFGALSAVQCAAGLAMVVLLPRMGSMRLLLTAATVVTATGLVAAGLPDPRATWAAVITLGCGLGALYSLTLALVTARVSSVADATWVSGAAFGIGYSIAAAGPLVAAAVRLWSGGFALPFLFAGVVVLLTIPLSRTLT